MKLSQLKQLAEYRARAESIEREWSAQKRVLLSLHSRLGYRSTKELIAMLKIAAEGTKLPSSASTRKSSRKRRTTITAETRALVQKMAHAGKTTREIAQEVNLSAASVFNIRKQFGLTRRRK